MSVSETEDGLPGVEVGDPAEAVGVRSAPRFPGDEPGPAAEATDRPQPKLRQLYWRRSARRPAAMFGLIIFCVFLFLAVFGPWVAPYDYQAQDAKLRLATPTLSHPFGADQFGRDILSRIIVGTRDIFVLGGLRHARSPWSSVRRSAWLQATSEARPTRS